MTLNNISLNIIIITSGPLHLNIRSLLLWGDGHGLNITVSFHLLFHSLVHSTLINIFELR